MSSDNNQNPVSVARDSNESVVRTSDGGTFVANTNDTVVPDSLAEITNDDHNDVNEVTSVYHPEISDKESAEKQEQRKRKRSDDKESSGLGQEQQPQLVISSVLLIIAVKTEALPIVEKFELTEYLKELPWFHYTGSYKDLRIDLVWPRTDSTFEVDSVGIISTSLETYAAAKALLPDLIINAGTVGGYKAIGADILDVDLGSDAAFVDRNNLNHVSNLYAVRSWQSYPTPNLLKELNLKTGKLSTGHLLEMSLQDRISVTANDVALQDMEGAAVAYVADLLNVPAIFVKVVAGIVDKDKATASEFPQNLDATTVLDQAVTKVVDFINGKSI